MAESKIKIVIDGEHHYYHVTYDFMPGMKAPRDRFERPLSPDDPEDIDILTVFEDDEEMPDSFIMEHRGEIYAQLWEDVAVKKVAALEAEGEMEADRREDLRI